MPHYRPTWTEISRSALAHNVRTFKKYIDEDCQLMAVVKADAYGHGLIDSAQTMLEAGADRLGVAIVEEAIQLRQAGFDVPILIFGFTPKDAVQEAAAYDLTLTVFTEDVLTEVVQVAERMKKQVNIHIKVDSGMHRIGLKQTEALHSLLEKNTSSYVYVEGIFTHFSDADNEDIAYTNQQFSHFLHVVEEVEKSYGPIPVKHCCNSAATIAFPHMHMDMVRVGVSLYGLYPGEHMKEMIQLQQVMSLKTMPVMIKDVLPGEPISYGRSYAPATPSIIATVPIGYGDGLPRALSNKGAVIINEKRAPIVGRVCMDQTMIDITSIEEVDERTAFTFFGDPHKGHISLQEVADQLDTIHYEITCQIGKRIPRYYI
ncbi:alanine racemase [Halobacillus karajensis]|uniref:Alanine racemase n=1 Tax=Halobacillus karajensis TaxID=195088 RepID=A0A024P3F3_9BACI|nr:alanine racemase [Halobacillus karajensis]CDQ19144.1 Alanine racemase [Halobacillus karajensis]CDQ22782.1 Alanine racemase [Halobacillus karajensis]CDQ26264.1 Alanine racemase [Halobacillus karajensis]